MTAQVTRESYHNLQRMTIYTAFGLACLLLVFAVGVAEGIMQPWMFVAILAADVVVLGAGCWLLWKYRRALGEEAGGGD